MVEVFKSKLTFSSRRPSLRMRRCLDMLSHNSTAKESQSVRPSVRFGATWVNDRVNINHIECRVSIYRANTHCITSALFPHSHPPTIRTQRAHPNNQSTATVWARFIKLIKSLHSHVPGRIQTSIMKRFNKHNNFCGSLSLSFSRSRIQINGFRTGSIPRLFASSRAWKWQNNNHTTRHVSSTGRARRVMENGM